MNEASNNSPDIYTLLCGVDLKNRTVGVVECIDGKPKGVKDLVIDAAFNIERSSVFDNFTVYADGSGIYNGRKFRCKDEFLHPEKYTDTEMWTEPNMEAFIGSIKMMANSGANNIETYETKCHNFIYVIEDYSAKSLTIVIPQEVILATALYNTKTRTKGIFAEGNRSASIYNEIIVVGGSPNLVSISGLLSMCNARTLDASKLYVDNVIDASYLFDDAYFTKLDLSWLRNAKLRQVMAMFRDMCVDSGTVNVSNLDLRWVKDTTQMFKNAGISELRGKFNMENLEKTSEMFSGCSITGVTTDIGTKTGAPLDVSSINMGKVEDARNMFERLRCTELRISGWNLDKLVNAKSMFMSCEIGKIAGIAELKTPRLRLIKNMFMEAVINSEVILSLTLPSIDSEYVDLFSFASINILDLKDVSYRDIDSRGRQMGAEHLKKNLSEDMCVFREFKGKLVFSSAKYHKDNQLFLQAGNAYRDGEKLDIYTK